MNQKTLSIHLKFDKHSPQPTRVFQAVERMILAFETLDTVLLGGLQSAITSELFLEDVKDGSLLVMLARKLNKTACHLPEDVLVSGDWKKFLGHFLVKAQRLLAEFVKNHENVESVEELHMLGRQIQAIAEESSMPLLPIYQAPSSAELLQTLQMFSHSLEPLKDGDRMLIGAGEGDEVELCSAFRVSDADIDRLLVRLEITNQAPMEMILKVRKPDFFGSSQWDFKWNAQPFKAKILDKKWLSEFMAKKTPLTPGDGLRAWVLSTIAYGWDNEVIRQQHVIQKVIEIIPGELSFQDKLVE